MFRLNEFIFMILFLKYNLGDFHFLSPGKSGVIYYQHYF
jgi:hypothetical protein